MSETFKLGKKNWAIADGNLLAYNDQNDNYKPIPIVCNRPDKGTVIDRNGLIVDRGVDIPRIDFNEYTDGALLTEPTRTNDNVYGIEIARWSGGAVKTANAGISPSGANDATMVAESSGLGNGALVIQNIPAGAFLYCQTIYYKSAGATTAKYRMFDGSTGASTTITLEPNDTWQRAEVKRTSGATTTQFRNDIYDNDGDILLWGSQLEKGNYATSVIPTYGSKITRLYDNYPPTGLEMQDYLGTDSGTWFIHVKDLRFDITGTGVGSINLTYTTTQLIEIIQDGWNQFKITLNNSNALENLDGEQKIAMAWDNTGFVIFANGQERYTNPVTTYSVPYRDLEISKSNRPVQGLIPEMKFWNTRLSPSELEELTKL
jgi:hypothetical protein